MRQRRIGLIITGLFIVLASGIGIWYFQFANQAVPVTGDIDLSETLIDTPEETVYDLVVVGGEPEGVAAAVSAARNGVKTLLIEHRDGLGGLFTYGWLNYLDIPRGYDDKILSKGIFEEWHKMVGKRDGFSIEQAKHAFLAMVAAEPLLTVMLETSIEAAATKQGDGDLISAVRVSNAAGEHIVHAKFFVDATQDADLAAMAGVPFFVGQEDLGFENRMMAVTPIIKVQNLDWNKVVKAARNGVLGGAGFNDTVIWGFVDLHERYTPKQDNIRLRGLNIVRAQTGDQEDFYINALHLFGVDVFDPASKAAALERGIAEFESILEYLKEALPGFEEAYIEEKPTEMYIRESRHILAEYQLKVSDLWRHRDHWDSIGYGGYPSDIQATSMGDLGFVAVNPDRYAIPFRSLVPLHVDNLLVVGRSAGYSSLAAGSTRIVPTGMVTGEAAGVAAAIALEHQVDFRSLSKDQDLVSQMRALLEEQGAWVAHYEAEYRYQGEFFDDALAYLLDHSIITTDYNNELYVDNPFNVKAYANIMLNGIRQTSISAPKGDTAALSALYGWPDDKIIAERDTFAQVIAETVLGEKLALDSAWDRAKSLGLIDNFIYERIDENRVLTRGEGFYIMAHLLKHMINESEESGAVQ